MSAIANAHENEIMNLLFTQASYTPPTNWYLGLFLSDPDEDGNATEVSFSSTGYARKELPRNTSHFTTATTGAITLAAIQSFPDAEADWGTVRGWGLFTASTGGLPKWKGLLTTPQAILSGDTFKVPAGTNGLTLTLD